MAKYRLIDYATGKAINRKRYESPEKAHQAQHEYLKKKIEDHEIHNNLIVIDRIPTPKDRKN